MSLEPWALTGWRWCSTNNSLDVLAITDKPHGLVMRYTGWDPIFRKDYPYDRGVPHRAYEVLFPKEWRAVNQNEPGSTTIHTFHLDFAPVRRMFWLIFVSQAPLFYSPSQMGPFQVFFPAPPVWTHIWTEEWTS